MITITESCRARSGDFSPRVAATLVTIRPRARLPQAHLRFIVVLLRGLTCRGVDSPINQEMRLGD